MLALKTPLCCKCLHCLLKITPDLPSDLLEGLGSQRHDPTQATQHSDARRANGVGLGPVRSPTLRAGFPCAGALHESLAHERLKAYVCVLYGSPCAPLLLPWLGEVEGTSLAMT